MSGNDPTTDRRVTPISAAGPTSATLEANALRHYAAVLKRRWMWVALGLLVGLLGGAASTLLIRDVQDPNRYFRATNTLVVNGGRLGQDVAAPNLTQSAFLLRSAEVSDEIAAATGLTTQDVNDYVSASARGDVLAIDVTAISTNPDMAVHLADTSAQELNEFIGTDQQNQYARQRDDLLAQREELKRRRVEKEQQIEDEPEQADLLRAEQDAIIDQYRSVNDQLEQLSSQGAPAGGLSTLQTATPVQINGAAYYARLNDNRNTLGGQTTASTVAAAGPSETDLSTGPPISKPMRVIIGAAAGLIMGIAAAFLVEAWDDRIRRRDRLEALTGLPVIAEVPRLPKDDSRTVIAAVDSPRSRAAERYRAVRAAILFALHDRREEAGSTDLWKDGQAPVIMITSPNPSEGKTTTVVNVAAMFADAGIRTLVIDCDYRKPSAAKYLAPTPDLNNPDAPASTRLDDVVFLPAPRGAKSPGEVVNRLRQTIVTWRSKVDMVILDTPPMMTTNDATDLLAAADAVVLVLRAGQSRTGPAERVGNVLARYRAEVLGIVFNACDDAHIDAYYGYYKGYGDAQEPTRAARAGRTDGKPGPDQAELDRNPPTTVS